MMIDIRHGDWRKALGDVEEVDAIITDPPYSPRTHGANRSPESLRAGDQGKARRTISYAAWHREDADALAGFAARVVKNWVVVMGDHTIAGWHKEALEREGFYTFAPLPWYCHGGTIRMSGDGPSNWTVWIVVARRRTGPVTKWGTLPGGYTASKGAVAKNHIGGKPRALMRAIIGDYTNPGDLVCDPCAGFGTTLLAAREYGCSSIGAEVDTDAFNEAQRRIQQPWQVQRHPRASRYEAKPQQATLL